MLLKKRKFDEVWLTKYVVGANAKPPKKPRRPPKKGKVMATNIVNAVTDKHHQIHTQHHTKIRTSGDL